MCSLNNRELLEAFVHFSHQASGGRLVVCGLEGQVDERSRVTLKTPVIHSLLQDFGETDLGRRGMREVMDRHQCNRHCRQVLGMTRSFSLPLPHSSQPHSSPWQPRIPSAPFEEEEEVVETDEVFQMYPRFPLVSAPPYCSLEELRYHLRRLTPATGFLPPDTTGFLPPRNGFLPPRNGFLSPDTGYLPLPPASPMEELQLLFRLELSKGVPEEAPPPYSEYIDQLA